MKLADWLPSTTPLIQRVIVENAIRSIGTLEDPLGSNRGPEIDKMNLRAGVPLGSYWCASWAGAIWQDAGAEVPEHYASCDAWLQWGQSTGRFTRHTAAVGCVVLYGSGTDARHCGVIIRTAPRILSVEGNTSVETGFERNGTAVSLKAVNEKSPVLGYVHPLGLPVAKAA
jgi:hypothetical protein